MKIAVVTYQVHSHGGIERTALALIRYLIRRGHEVTAIVNQFEHESTSEVRIVKVRRHAPAGSLLQSIAFYHQVSGLLEHSRPDVDIVHALGAPVSGADIISAQYCHAAWLEVATTIDRSPRAMIKRHNPAGRYMAFLEGRAYRCSSVKAITSVSSRTANELATHHGLPYQAIHIIPNGLDGSLLRDSSGARAEIRRKFAIDQANSVILFAGSVVDGFERKGLLPLMHAVASIPRDDLHLLVLGEGDPGRFAKLADQLGIARRITFTAAKGDVDKYFHASDLLVLPTLYEAQGMTIIEALHHGVPVITSKRTGVDLSDGYNALLLDNPLSAPEIGRKIERIIHDPEMRRALITNGRKTSEQYEWDRLLVKYESLYEMLSGGCQA